MMTTLHGRHFFPNEIIDDCGFDSDWRLIILLVTAVEPQTLTWFSFTPSFLMQDIEICDKISNNNNKDNILK